MRTLFALVLFAPVAVHAEPPSPEDVAKIQHEQKAASDEVDKKYGNKPSSELSQDERRQMIRDKAEAERAVLDKHNVDAKDFARGTAKQSLSDRAATKAANDKLEKQDADAKAASGARPDAKNSPAAADSAAKDAEEAAAADRAKGYGSKKKLPK